MLVLSWQVGGLASSLSCTGSGGGGCYWPNPRPAWPIASHCGRPVAGPSHCRPLFLPAPPTSGGKGTHWPLSLQGPALSRRSRDSEVMGNKQEGNAYEQKVHTIFVLPSCHIVFFRCLSRKIEICPFEKIPSTGGGQFRGFQTTMIK